VSIPPTLLLADDSLTIQRVVSLTFADQPVRLVVAKDGQDAINRMAKERPDLVLADTNMPCVDGYELARWVRDQPHLSTVPVLLLAGVADPVDEQRLHDSGANGVLEKPFEPSHVISRVKELLGLRGAAPAAAGGRLVTAPNVGAAPAPVRNPEAAPRPADSGAGRAGTPSQDSVSDDPSITRAGEGAEPAPDQSQASEYATRGEVASDVSARFDAPPGDTPDWFAEDAASLSSGPSVLLAEELNLSVPAFDGTVDARGSSPGTDHPLPPASSSSVASSRAHTLGSPADVFESLLAAEQGQTLPPGLASTSADLSPAVLDDLATRVAERLRPQLQTLGSDMRSSVAEMVQAAVNDALERALHGAVDVAVTAVVPSAIERHLGARVEHALATSLADVVRETVANQVRDGVVPAIRDSVREVADAAIRNELAEVVAAAVPAAVLDAVRGDSNGQVRQVVRETAERLVSEEIARIRERRTS
jgi:CheY-like chemotaxis protein